MGHAKRTLWDWDLNDCGGACNGPGWTSSSGEAGTEAASIDGSDGVDDDSPAGGTGKRPRISVEGDGHGAVYPVAGQQVVAAAGSRGGVEEAGDGGSASGCPASPSCQVEGCRADLRAAKEYHRKHKVCATHSKASEVVVRGIAQRFCQQCSRFHLLDAFDEGKRSCRRRLARHNEKRRKVQVGANGSLFDWSFILLSLLKLLSNLENTNSTDQNGNQTLLLHCLMSLANLAGQSIPTDISGLLQASQEHHKLGSSSSRAANTKTNGNSSAMQEIFQQTAAQLQQSVKDHIHRNSSVVPVENTPGRSNIRMGVPPVVADRGHEDIIGRMIATINTTSSQGNGHASTKHTVAANQNLSMNGLQIDLNDAYCDQECTAVEPTIPSYQFCANNQPTQLQLCGNGSSSMLSRIEPSKNQTDKIMFKLFGKDPNRIPDDLLTQVRQWLLFSPNDLESYIRPGCIILTIYVSLTMSMWDELENNLAAHIEKLVSINEYWRSGWIFATVRRRMAFTYNGMLLLEAPLHAHFQDRALLSVSPIAVSCDSLATFSVKIFSQPKPISRFISAFNGKYIAQEGVEAVKNKNVLTSPGTQHHHLSCSLSSETGRGFIEVEDYYLISSPFFPFVVAEKDLCSEICTLENELTVMSTSSDFSDARIKALEFLQEMGWLLWHDQMRLRWNQPESCITMGFSLERLKWLMSFVMHQQWCAVMKKLLDLLFQGNVIDLNDTSPFHFIREESFLHKAVKQGSKPLVESLLRYTIHAYPREPDRVCFVFTPDMTDSNGRTPLHEAASMSGAEGVIEALINDPQQLGARAWWSTYDNHQHTPNDYACKHRYTSYIQIVWNKVYGIPKSHPGIIIGIPSDEYRSAIKPPPCKICASQSASCRRILRGQSKLYSPAAFFSVLIATVCVCIGLCLYTLPDIGGQYQPFLWTSLGSGSM